MYKFAEIQAFYQIARYVKKLNSAEDLGEESCGDGRQAILY